MYFYHLTVVSSDIDSTTITNALSTYGALEYAPNCWFIKANEPVNTLFDKIRPIVGDATVCLYGFRPDALIGGIWPDNVKTYLGVQTRTQAA